MSRTVPTVHRPGRGRPGTNVPRSGNDLADDVERGGRRAGSLSSAGELVRLDGGEAVGVLGMVPDHVVLDLVGIDEAELAVRAVMGMQFIEHGSSERRPGGEGKGRNVPRRGGTSASCRPGGRVRIGRRRRSEPGRPARAWSQHLRGAAQWCRTFGGMSGRSPLLERGAGSATVAA